MWTGYMQTLCHFLKKTWASLNFGIHGHPGSNVPWMSACSVALSCLILCNPIDCRNPPGSSVHAILQERILEWVAISSSRGSSQSSDQSRVSCGSCIGRWILYPWATWEILYYILSSYYWEKLRVGKGLSGSKTHYVSFFIFYCL